MENNNEQTATTTESSGANATTQTQSAGASGGTAAAGAPGAQTQGTGNDGAAPQGTGAGTAEQQAAQAAAYSPNFKFKVKDKELEFDDFVKPIIKNKDLEAKFREMYEKAHGIEEVKASREQLKTQAQEWQGKYTQVEQGLKSLGDVVKKKDFDSLFDVFKISEDDIINWSIGKLKYRELPADQRAVIDQQRQQQIEFDSATTMNQQLQQQMQMLQGQQATMELNQELARPDIVSIATAYDTRTGKPGSFKTEVIRRGQYYEAVHKISPPASQLVAELVSLIGAPAPSTQTQEATSQGQSGQTTQAQQQKPVIANFQSGGAKSPARKVINSIDDLRALRQQNLSST
jgi:hypothetical protein